MFDRINALLRERAKAKAMHDTDRVRNIDRDLKANGHMPETERAVDARKVTRRGR